MPTRQNFSFFLIFFTIQFILNYSTFAGNVMYFSADGNPITKQQFDEESKKSQEKYQEIKMAEIQSRLKETDNLGRPLYKFKDEKLINIVYETSNANPNPNPNAISTSQLYDHNGNPTNDPKFIDSKGRPIYTSTGGHYIYSDMLPNGNSTNDTKFIDSKGRPIYTSTGGHHN